MLKLSLFCRFQQHSVSMLMAYIFFPKSDIFSPSSNEEAKYLHLILNNNQSIVYNHVVCTYMSI